jgi:hypothetical protein
MHLDVILDYMVSKKGRLPNPKFCLSIFHMPTPPTPKTSNVNDMKSHKNKGYWKGLSLTFKQGTRQNSMIQKCEHHYTKSFCKNGRSRARC